MVVESLGMRPKAIFRWEGLPSKGLKGLCPALALQDAYEDTMKAVSSTIRSTRFDDVTALSRRSEYSWREILNDGSIEWFTKSESSVRCFIKQR